MWVAPSLLFSRRRGPHIKNFRGGSKWEMSGAFLYAYALFSLLTYILPEMPYLQGGSGTELEPETGTVGTVFPGTESGTGTAGTVFQEPKPEPSFPVKLY